MTRVLHWGTALQRSMPVLLALCSLPAAALDVKLKFQLPNGIGHVNAGFTGFDINRDGMIRSSDKEVIFAWSSLTGELYLASFASAINDLSGKIDIQYRYPSEHIPRSGGYREGDYFGLSKFAIETKLETGNRIRNSSIQFRLDARQPAFTASGFSWSDVYNAPSSFAYSFVGPENAVGLSLETSGDVFATAVPEPSMLFLMATGLTGLLLRNRVLISARTLDSLLDRQADIPHS